MKEGIDSNIEYDVFSLGNGYLVSNSDECSDLVEKLIENGSLWDFLSSLINAYINKEDVKYIMEQVYSVEELGKKQEDKLKELQQNFHSDLAKVMSEISTIKSSLASGVTVSSSQETLIPKPKVEAVKTRVKKSKGTPNLKGGFMKSAMKMGSMDRKDT